VTYTVAPPDQAVWWDVADITAAALEVLRLTAGDLDADRIAELVPAAGQRINNHLDRTGDDPVTVDDPVLRQALVDMTVADYRAAAPTSPDLAFGVGYPPADPLTQIRPQLAAHKQRHGIA
jgi:hypothetical protein